MSNLFAGVSEDLNDVHDKVGKDGSEERQETWTRDDQGWNDSSSCFEHVPRASVSIVTSIIVRPMACHHSSRAFASSAIIPEMLSITDTRRDSRSHS